MTKPKILTLDIETAPLEAYIWRLFDENVGLDQLKTEWTVLSYCAKWLGSKEIIYADAGGRGVGKVRDDYALLKGIRELLDEAEIVVAQNGNSFDLKKINARLAMHGFGPYSPVRKIDTYRAAKTYFGFTSNKLQWLAKHLTNAPKSEHKRFPGFELWAEVLKDNPKAWAEMKRYNIRDVRATEKLYLKLRPWIANHPNMGMYIDSAKPVCPKCAGTRFMRNGARATLQQGIYERLQCLTCGGWSRGKIMKVDKETRMSKLVGL